MLQWQYEFLYYLYPELVSESTETIEQRIQQHKLVEEQLEKIDYSTPLAQAFFAGWDIHKQYIGVSLKVLSRQNDEDHVEYAGALRLDMSKHPSPLKQY